MIKVFKLMLIRKVINNQQFVSIVFFQYVVRFSSLPFTSTKRSIVGNGTHRSLRSKDIWITALTNIMRWVCSARAPSALFYYVDTNTQMSKLQSRSSKRSGQMKCTQLTTKCLRSLISCEKLHITAVQTSQSCRRFLKTMDSSILPQSSTRVVTSSIT